MIKFDYIMVRVKDLEKSKKLYELLGLRFRLEKHEKGPEHYSGDLNGIVFELYPWNKGDVIDFRTIRLGIIVENLEQVRDTLESFCKNNELAFEKFEGPFRIEIRDFEQRTIELSSPSV